jgi:predicted phosphodiesterase
MEGVSPVSQPLRIAFVSDVHGNLPALQAVLAELDRRGPFTTQVGGGDYAFGGAYPQRCVDLMRQRGFECVRGNTDEWVVESATAGMRPAKGYTPAEAHSGALLMVDDWIARQLSQDGVRFLAELPTAWRTTGPSGQRLTFVHATPASTHRTVQPDAGEETFTQLLDEAETDVLLYGHIHRAFTLRVGERMVGCVGSVGVPMDGDERPCCAIATDDGAGWQVEHVRLIYNRDAYLSDLARSGLPNASTFIDMIRRAGA